MDVAVISGHQQGQLTAIARHAQSGAQVFGEMDTAIFVANVPGQDVGRCGSLAEIVRHGCEAYGQFRSAPCRLVDDHHGMDAGIDFRVVVGALRDPEKCIQFGEQAGQCAAIAQYLEHPGRRNLHQPFGQLLPDALRYQVIHFAAFHHLAHERHRLRRDGEVAETGSKACNAENADRIFGKGRSDMP